MRCAFQCVSNLLKTLPTPNYPNQSFHSCVKNRTDKNWAKEMLLACENNISVLTDVCPYCCAISSASLTPNEILRSYWFMKRKRSGNGAVWRQFRASRTCYARLAPFRSMFVLATSHVSSRRVACKWQAEPAHARVSTSRFSLVVSLLVACANLQTLRCCEYSVRGSLWRCPSRTTSRSTWSLSSL